MDYNTLFHRFSEQPALSPEDRAELITELKKQAERLEHSSHLTTQISYGIAGLMATDFAHQLAVNDPLEEVFTISGELETCPDNADELRTELI